MQVLILKHQPLCSWGLKSSETGKTTNGGRPLKQMTCGCFLNQMALEVQTLCGPRKPYYETNDMLPNCAISVLVSWYCCSQMKLSSHCMVLANLLCCAASILLVCSTRQGTELHMGRTISDGPTAPPMSSLMPKLSSACGCCC